MQDNMIYKYPIVFIMGTYIGGYNDGFELTRGQFSNMHIPVYRNQTHVDGLKPWVYIGINFLSLFDS